MHNIGVKEIKKSYFYFLQSFGRDPYKKVLHCHEGAICFRDGWNFVVYMIQAVGACFAHSLGVGDEELE